MRMTYGILGKRDGREKSNGGERLHFWLDAVGGKEWTSSLVSTTTRKGYEREGERKAFGGRLEIALFFRLMDCC